MHGASLPSSQELSYAWDWHLQHPNLFHHVDHWQDTLTTTERLVATSDMRGKIRLTLPTDPLDLLDIDGFTLTAAEQKGIRAWKRNLCLYDADTGNIGMPMASPSSDEVSSALRNALVALRPPAARTPTGWRRALPWNWLRQPAEPDDRIALL